MKQKIISLICVIGMLGGVGLILYPTASNLWNEYRNSKMVASYNEIVSERTDLELKEMMDAAVEYNKEHLKTGNYVKDAFNESEEYILTHPYGALLNPSKNDVMGYIEIPAIGVRIAIYHGVGTEALSKGVGHIEGTSLPVGGESTHSVLSAHRGLPAAELFTNLDQLKEGDMFYIHVLNQTLAYEVSIIHDMVEPNDISNLKIINGEDLITLLTCTPYSINTHRLLVTGHRVPYNVDDDETVTTIDRIADFPMRIIVMVCGIIFVFIGLVIIICISRKKKKLINKNNLY